jgi:phage FluMu gp28-like protein
MCISGHDGQILLSYQREWILDRSPVKVCEKSRRTGITWASALEAVLTASASVSDGGMDVYFMTMTEEDSKEFIRDCETWARVVGVLHGEVWIDDDGGEPRTVNGEIVKVKILSLEFPSIGGGKSFRIHALAGRPRKFRGKQGLAIIDEAAHVDDLDGIRTACMAFLMWGGRVAFISTHCGEENAFNKIVSEARDDDESKWGFHSIPLAEAIHQGLARRIAAVSGQEYSDEWGEQWESDVRKFYGQSGPEELDCIPSRQGAGYFDPNSVALCRTKGLTVLRWKKAREWGDMPPRQREKECEAWIERELIPVIKRLNPMRGSALGVDFARYIDGSVWVLAQMFGDVRRCVLTVELFCIPLAQQQQILGAILRGAPRMAKAHFDETGSGFALCEWAKDHFGRMVEGFNLGPRWHDENWPELHTAVTERRIDIPDDDDSAGDFKLVERIDGKPRVSKRRVKGKMGELRHGDFAVSCALMYSASKGVGSRVSASPVPKRTNNRQL